MAEAIAQALRRGREVRKGVPEGSRARQGRSLIGDGVEPA